jgi:hypothetical protein
MTCITSDDGIDDSDEMLTASELSDWLKVGHNYPYVQLRHLALNVGGTAAKPLLRWMKGDVLKYIGGRTRNAECQVNG